MSHPNQQPPPPPLPFQTSPGMAPVRKDRSFIWIILIALAGWALFAVPALWLFFSSFFSMGTGPGLGGGRPGALTYVIFSLVSVACMIFSPVLLGCAVTFRRTGLWIAGIITVIPALVGAAYIYLQPYL